MGYMLFCRLAPVQLNGSGLAGEGEAVGREPASHGFGGVGRAQGRAVRWPDFRQVGPAGPRYVEPQDGKNGPRAGQQRFVPRPGGGAGEHVAGPPDDDLLEHVVQARCREHSMPLASRRSALAEDVRVKPDRERLRNDACFYQGPFLL
jgi:hypothetical protein